MRSKRTRGIRVLKGSQALYTTSWAGKKNWYASGSGKGLARYGSVMCEFYFSREQLREIKDGIYRSRNVRRY